LTNPAKLLVATNNRGKLREYARLLGELPFELVTLSDVGIEAEVEETGSTMEENAVSKAVAYSKMSGLVALADDSGLEVDALNGEPGVRSRRYAGDNASDEERNRYLLSKLSGVTPGERGARFRCVIALATPDGNVWTCEGTCDGVIALEARGQGGFGYDPVFLVPGLGKHMAELTLDEKNEVSHRARAARKAREILLSLGERGLI